jgi:hypothetical protein
MGMNDMPVSLERMLHELSLLSLETPEGLSYSPKILIERADDGTLSRLEVAIIVTMPGGAEHDVRLVPSTETDEGWGNGNIFLYEDDDALTHVAWREKE